MTALCFLWAIQLIIIIFDTLHNPAPAKVIFQISFLIENFLSLYSMFNIITRKTLLDYCRRYPAAAIALQEWYHDLLNTDFRHFNDLKKAYASASLVGDDRVVFNIMGNKYRLVTRIVFEYKAIQIKWFGTHAEYDKVDVSTVKFKK